MKLKIKIDLIVELKKLGMCTLDYSYENKGVWVSKVNVWYKLVSPSAEYKKNLE